MHVCRPKPDLHCRYAIALAKKKMNVVLVARSKDKLDAVAAEIKALGLVLLVTHPLSHSNKLTPLRILSPCAHYHVHGYPYHSTSTWLCSLAVLSIAVTTAHIASCRCRRTTVVHRPCLGGACAHPASLHPNYFCRVDAIVVAADLTDPAAIAAVSKAIDGLDVGVLINNAGLSYSYPDYLVSTGDIESHIVRCPPLPSLPSFLLPAHTHQPYFLIEVSARTPALNDVTWKRSRGRCVMRLGVFTNGGGLI